jgi:hypothetical protein
MTYLIEPRAITQGSRCPKQCLQYCRIKPCYGVPY